MYMSLVFTCSIDTILVMTEPLAVTGEAPLLAGSDCLLYLGHSLLKSQQNILEILTLGCGHDLQLVISVDPDQEVVILVDEYSST